jgi:hypothetical protein
MMVVGVKLSQGSEKCIMWVGSARTTCSASRTSTKIESERFVVRREERVAKSASQLHSALCVQFITRLKLARFHAV